MRVGGDGTRLHWGVALVAGVVSSVIFRKMGNMEDRARYRSCDGEGIQLDIDLPYQLTKGEGRALTTIERTWTPVSLSVATVEQRHGENG